MYAQAIEKTNEAKPADLAHLAVELPKNQDRDELLSATKAGERELTGAGKKDPEVQAKHERVSSLGVSSQKLVNITEMEFSEVS